MAKARWWMCADCRSLNDLPANRCYKCRAAKPADPSLLDDQYGLVSRGTPRVGITVDLSRIGELIAPDPKETQPPSGAFEVYGARDDEPLESVRLANEPKVPPPPLREPVKRAISEVGLHWSHGLTGAPEDASAPTGEDAPAATVSPTAPVEPPAAAPPRGAPQGGPPMSPRPPTSSGPPMPPGQRFAAAPTRPPVPGRPPGPPGPPPRLLGPPPGRFAPPPGTMPPRAKPPPAMPSPPQPGGPLWPPEGRPVPPVRDDQPMAPSEDQDENTHR